MKSPYKSIAVQSIGWADIIISEGAVDPNDYRMSPHDPYNTDDDVVDDLFDQWLQSKSGQTTISRCDWSDECKENLQLAFELGAQIAMTSQFHRQDGPTIDVPDDSSSNYIHARSYALHDYGVLSKEDMSDQGKIAASRGAFDAGYKAISSTHQQ